mmetsp:Transcript_100266/g.239058  ORF Transcript_100266/g.239058 Transcript_100266/m.239058 type:complete len:212 (+) Transcript_100266:53-688(+)
MALPMSCVDTAPSGEDKASQSGQACSSMSANASQGALLPNVVPGGQGVEGLRVPDGQWEAFLTRVHCLDAEDFAKLCREIGREDADPEEIDVRWQYRQVQDRTAGPQNGSRLERAMPDLLRLPSFDRILSCESFESLESFHSMRVRRRWAERGDFNATVHDDDDDSMTSRLRNDPRQNGARWIVFPSLGVTAKATRMKNWLRSALKSHSTR